jgi:hypothetical protein
MKLTGTAINGSRSGLDASWIAPTVTSQPNPTEAVKNTANG